jgi:hypothetical protein
VLLKNNFLAKQQAPTMSKRSAYLLEVRSCSHPRLASRFSKGAAGFVSKLIGSLV